jgi:hypothetical protein
MSKKKLLSLVLAVILLVSVSSPAAFAATPLTTTGLNAITKGMVTIQWTYINYVSTSLYIDSNGIATIFGFIQRTTNGNYLYLSCTLQRYTSGTWIDIANWYTTSYSSSALIDEQYSVPNGTYRVRCNYYASGSGGSDSGVIYSVTVVY